MDSSITKNNGGGKARVQEEVGSQWSPAPRGLFLLLLHPLDEVKHQGQRAVSSRPDREPVGNIGPVRQLELGAGDGLHAHLQQHLGHLRLFYPIEFTSTIHMQYVASASREDASV